MISSLPSPLRSYSTGEAVAPRVRWRVNGSCGRGIGGVTAPWLNAFGVQLFLRLPLSLKTYTVPLVVVTTTFRNPLPARSPTATLLTMGSKPGSIPACGLVTTVGSVCAGHPGSSAPDCESMACTQPSASPNTMARRPLPCRSTSAG